MCFIKYHRLIYAISKGCMSPASSCRRREKTVEKRNLFWSRVSGLAVWQSNALADARHRQSRHQRLRSESGEWRLEIGEVNQVRSPDSGPVDCSASARAGAAAELRSLTEPAQLRPLARPQC